MLLHFGLKKPVDPNTFLFFLKIWSAGPVDQQIILKRNTFWQRVLVLISKRS